jgi:hypothetical protein
VEILLLGLLGLFCFALWLILRKPKSLKDTFLALDALEKQLRDEAAAKKDAE